MNKLTPILFAVVLLGASCAPAEKVTNNIPSTPKPAPVAGKLEDVKMPDEKKTEVTAPKSEGVRELTPAVTDETWKQYTSKAFGFTFMWPTKGRYAPEWEVKLYESNNKNIGSDGCHIVPPPDVRTATVNVRVNEQAFCHTNGSIVNEPDVDDDARIKIDFYTTSFGSKFVTIQFTKTVYVANEDCRKTSGAALTTVKNACAPWTEDEYQSTLNGIVGTFKLKAE